MTFEVAADSYGRFMGRYSEPLAIVFADSVPLAPGHRVLDVGCGPGALTNVLVDRLGAAAVSAVDPSEPFVTAAQERFPGLDVRLTGGETLPYDDDTFDAALAQLVVNFMPDPVAGLREMTRVTRPGGTVAACLWDFAGAAAPLSVFWQAVLDLDQASGPEADTAGPGGAGLEGLFVQAGFTGSALSHLTVNVACPSFDAWWEPYTLGVGPAGAHVQSIDADQREALQARCRDLLPPAPFVVTASAWSVAGTVPDA